MLVVITHRNAPRLPYQKQHPTPPVDPEIGAQLPMLQDDLVRHNGQHIGVVVAETFEQATHAADLVRVAYEEEPAATALDAALPHAFPVTEGKRGRRDARRLPPRRSRPRARGGAGHGR